ncbi:MAG: phosphatidate cytidylyltransferase [Pseudomonadota bacterium]
MNSAPGRWGDLRPRLISAAVMLAVGAVEIWLGGLWFLVLITALTAIMVWELALMTAPGDSIRALALAALAALSLILDEGWPSVPAYWLFPVMALAFYLTPRRNRLAAALLAVAIMVAGHGLFVLRDESGTPAILWLIGVVIASDVMGYFAGRLLGGPKFWPAVSPKKTWSGTVAGWLGAALVGLGFVLAGYGTWWLVAISPFLALAGQMGDIAESWIKRRTGVKDSSSLIPGHGGLMDRFDALVGAMVFVMVLTRVVPLPIGP